MFRELLSQPRPYAWGDQSSIALWQGRTPTGAPEAELWWGTHSGSGALVLEAPGEMESLDAWLEKHGALAELPFLVKLLAAEKPLSIQVHPSKQQALLGFADENDRGLDREAPSRNYRDDSDKPEILIAWSEEFHALVGFQGPGMISTTLAIICDALGETPLTQTLRQAISGGPSALASWLFSGDSEVGRLASALEQKWDVDDENVPETWRRVAPSYPGDSGALVALFLNHIRLTRGEALFVPPGIPHAYLEGFGLEVMAPSDNVLRGGLTPKHVDRAEFLSIVNSDPFDRALIEPVADLPHGALFAPPGVSFEVTKSAGDAVTIPFANAEPVVVVVESGEFYSGDAADPVLVGGKAYIGLGKETPPSLMGSGSIYIVSGI